MSHTWLDKAEGQLLNDEGTILDPVILEATAELIKAEGVTTQENKKLDTVIDDVISGRKMMSVAQLRELDNRFADRYLEEDYRNLVATSSQKKVSIQMPTIGDTVFARSSGEPGRVASMIGTGSPSYKQVQQEYANRYGLDRASIHEGSTAVYRVVHADGVEELYYDTELSVEPVVASMPYLPQERKSEMVDKALLKEALGLWWSLLPESERQAQFTRSGSDLNVLGKIEAKYATSTQDDVFGFHPALAAAYNYVAKQKTVKADGIDWNRQNIVTHSEEFICPKCHEPGKPSDMQITDKADGLVKATLCTNCAEQIERDLEGYSLSDIEGQ